MKRYSSRKEKRGALDVKAILIDGQNISPEWAGGEMFEADISSFEERIVGFGLSHLLDYDVMGKLDGTDIIEQVVKALGATKPEINSFDKINNEAWFLVNFLRYRFHMSSGEKRVIVNNAIGLGRLIEWWRWRKENIEKAALSQINRVNASGKGGGKSSKVRRLYRLDAFIEEIEKLGGCYPQMSETAIIEQAFLNSSNIHENFWKIGSGQAEKFATSLRSDEPYKTRYYAIFGKTA